jgi:hypothetical protein
LPCPGPLSAPERDEKQLYGYRFKPLEASRRTLGVVLAIVLVGLVALFGNWYAHTIRRLERSTGRASEKRAGKVHRLAEGKFLKENLAPNRPVAQQQANRIMEIVPKAAPGVTPNQASQYNAMTGQWVPIAPASQPTPALGGAGMAENQPLMRAEPVPAAPTPAEPPKPAPDPAGEKKAASKLYRAKKLEQEGKVRLASQLYQEIMDEYPDTEASQTAKTKSFRISDTRADKAGRELAHAMSFERTNSLEEARAEYAGVVARYPETDAAKQARERLEAFKK